MDERPVGFLTLIGFQCFQSIFEWFMIFDLGGLEISVYLVTNRLLYPGTMWTFQRSPPWICFADTSKFGRKCLIFGYRELRIEVEDYLLDSFFLSAIGM